MPELLGKSIQLVQVSSFKGDCALGGVRIHGLPLIRWSLYHTRATQLVGMTHTITRKAKCRVLCSIIIKSISVFIVQPQAFFGEYSM